MPPTPPASLIFSSSTSEAIVLSFSPASSIGSCNRLGPLRASLLAPLTASGTAAAKPAPNATPVRPDTGPLSLRLFMVFGTTLCAP
jgi:hypothetical protein